MGKTLSMMHTDGEATSRPPTEGLRPAGKGTHGEGPEGNRELPDPRPRPCDLVRYAGRVAVVLARQPYYTKEGARPHPTQGREDVEEEDEEVREEGGEKAQEVSRGSSEPVAAVDGDDLAGDAGAVVGREQRGHAGELLGFEHAVLRALG